jgi:hypothetical protein
VVKTTFVLVFEMPLAKLQNPYDAIMMIEIKKGKRYLSSEKSLAIISVRKKVLANQIRAIVSGMQSLNFFTFWIKYPNPIKKKMVNVMLELVGGLFHPRLNVELGYAPGI